jgi:hypothetical protein
LIPAKLPGAIDERVYEVGHKRKHAATLTAVASAMSSISRERKYGLR